MIDLDRELRATLDERARLAPPPVDARLAIRAAHRRQLVVVLAAIAVAAIVAIGSTAGAISLLRSSGRLTPANPSEGSTAAPVPVALRATVRYDGATCTYTGPRTIVAGQQYLSIRFKDRARWDSWGGLVLGGLSESATYGQLIAWSATHHPDFFGSFPPRKFLVPGSAQQISALARWTPTDPFTDPGPRYYLACLTYGHAHGSGMLPATLLEVTDG